jgi:hypothetical protein
MSNVALRSADAVLLPLFAGDFDFFASGDFDFFASGDFDFFASGDVDINLLFTEIFNGVTVFLGGVLNGVIFDGVFRGDTFDGVFWGVDVATFWGVSGETGGVSGDRLIERWDRLVERWDRLVERWDFVGLLYFSLSSSLLLPELLLVLLTLRSS